MDAEIGMTVNNKSTSLIKSMEITSKLVMHRIPTLRIDYESFHETLDVAS